MVRGAMVARRRQSRGRRKHQGIGVCRHQKRRSGEQCGNRKIGFHFLSSGECWDTSLLNSPHCAVSLGWCQPCYLQSDCRAQLGRESHGTVGTGYRRVDKRMELESYLWYGKTAPSTSFAVLHRGYRGAWLRFTVETARMLGCGAKAQGSFRTHSARRSWPG